MAIINRLRELTEVGQSFWLDNLTKNKLQRDEIRHRMQEQGLRGITTNPSIFHKAISRGADYDQQIEDLGRQNTSIPAIYENLVVCDIQQACDVLQPVYRESGGDDGYVSVEVAARLAHDTEGTLQEARRLFESIKRPNLFIKVPGTLAGVPAIEQLVTEGINVNITLLFSVERYREVAEAYMRALESRDREGLPLDNVASVASFFISRVDVLVDQLLAHRMVPEKRDSRPVRPRQLMGTAATANAKLAYRAFRDMLETDRWRHLAGKGARIQRVLWGSTSTKNPDYSDVKYLESLVGPYTVNTMPDATAECFAEHGRIDAHAVERNLDEARDTIANLETLGIRFDCVTYQLLNEGIQKFIDPYEKTLVSIRDKLQQREHVTEEGIVS